MIFESKEIGRWKFLAQGVGVPPTDFELVQMTAAVGTLSSNTITFKNPFSQDIQVRVELRNENDSEECF